jgi:hypothetical protein
VKNWSDWVAEKPKMVDIVKWVTVEMPSTSHQPGSWVKNHSHYQMERYGWEIVVVVMQNTTMIHETTYRHFQDPIHDQHSWSTMDCHGDSFFLSGCLSGGVCITDGFLRLSSELLGLSAWSLIIHIMIKFRVPLLIPNLYWSWIDSHLVLFLFSLGGPSC